MTNKAKILRLLSLSLAVTGFVLVSGSFVETNAQGRDPFSKPGWARTRDAKSGAPGRTGGPKVAGAAVNTGVPGIQQRIEFYKRVRETAAANGQPLPKVTSVLTLDEMTVTGIFRTPRGYAAMIEATPIQLSYTVYPGEKFFDGQLVAVEENRLVFRKVVKTGNGKFVSSVENKALRQYSDREQIQGTAPAGLDDSATQARPVVQSANADPKAAPVPIVSPLDEMNKQIPSDPAKEESKSGKKTVKVAKKN